MNKHFVAHVIFVGVLALLAMALVSAPIAMPHKYVAGVMLAAAAAAYAAVTVRMVPRFIKVGRGGYIK